MSAVFLVLDFLIPLFFFLLGESVGGNKRRLLVKESLKTFCVSLLFAPIGAIFFSLPVQGMICAAVLLMQVLLVCAKAAVQKN